MKLKTIAAASAVALTAFGAQASTVFDGGDHGSFKAVIESPASGAFFNTYAFTLSATSSVTATFASAGITGFAGLFMADDTPVASWGVGGASFTGTSTWSLDAGSYYYAVSGLSKPGNYSLTSTAVAAVPEPETYALLGAGLGIVGFVASRRRREY
jgi:hypothetical protein